MTSLRCEEPGWIRCGGQDRRGLWYRDAADGVVELCAGREGNDDYARIERGVALDDRAFAALREVLSTAAFALETERADEARSPLYVAVLRIEAWLHEALALARQPIVAPVRMEVMVALQNAADALGVALRGE